MKDFNAKHIASDQGYDIYEIGPLHHLVTKGGRVLGDFKGGIDGLTIEALHELARLFNSRKLTY